MKEKLQYEQRRQRLAETSNKQKEYDQLLEIKKKEIEALGKCLHQVYAKLNESPETVPRLQEQLQEKDHELISVVTENKMLQSSYEKLVADHEHLQHQYEQLIVELKMKKELTESNEFFSSNDPRDTAVMEPQVCTSMHIHVPILLYLYCNAHGCACPFVFKRGSWV